MRPGSVVQSAQFERGPPIMNRGYRARSGMQTEVARQRRNAHCCCTCRSKRRRSSACTPSSTQRTRAHHASTSRGATTEVPLRRATRQWHRIHLNRPIKWMDPGVFWHGPHRTAMLDAQTAGGARHCGGRPNPSIGSAQAGATRSTICSGAAESSTTDVRIRGAAIA